MMPWISSTHCWLHVGGKWIAVEHICAALDGGDGKTDLLLAGGHTVLVGASIDDVMAKVVDLQGGAQ